jgi:acetyl esterase/lipase
MKKSVSILFSILVISFIAKNGFAQEKKTTPVPDNLVVEEVRFTSKGANGQTLIIAYPKNITSSLPAIIHFHGGGFKQGAAEEKTALLFAKAGFVGISINYRLSGEAIFPAAVHDCKTAVRWARANAKKYGIDPNKIGAFGGSAGGHLALMLGTSAGDKYLEGDGEYPEFSSNVKTVVANYPPTDFLRMNDVKGDIDHDAAKSPESLFIGGAIQTMKEVVQKANPIAYLDKNDPPMLILHGRMDGSVPMSQSELLVAELKKLGIKHEFIIVENAGHGFKPKPDANAIIKPSKEEIEQKWIEWFRGNL